MHKKSFIIGGAGFIGSHLVDLCLAHNHQVWVYDNFTTGKRSHLAPHPALTILEGNILDPATLQLALIAAAPDIIFHLAAIHHIPTCEKQPAEALRVNIEGTQQVINATAAWPTAPRLVFSSTGALYDPANTGVLHEDSPLKATDIYSLSKTTCEQLLRFHSAKTGAQVQVARLFNTVGRRETNAHLIPAIVEQLSSGSRQVHLGNLTPRRDYIHVEDVAQALFTLGEFPVQHTYDCFNVGSGKEFSVLEVARLFEQALSEPLEITSDPERQRKVDRPSQQADISRLRAASAWQPQRSLPQAIQEIWQEHLQASQSQDSGVTR